MRTRIRRRSEPLRAAEVLSRWFGKKHLEAEVRQYGLWSRWPELVGERLAARTEPRSLKNGVLVVAVATSAWLNELSFMRAELVGRINELLGSGTVTAIRLVSGPVRPITSPQDAPGAPPLPERTVAPELQQEVERDCASVTDPELRQVIEGARLADLRWPR